MMYPWYYVVLGLLMFAGQIMGAIKCFGGGTKRPKWLNITVGVMLCLMLIAALNS